MSFMRWIGIRKKIREESPLYRFSKTDISNGEYWNKNLDSSPYWKYLPYNYIQVVNNTTQNLILTTDTVTKLIPSGTIISLDEESLPAFRQFSIANLSGTDATGSIEVIVQKIKSQRMILRELASQRGML